MSILFLIFAAAAETIGTFTGFGATTILLPLATLLMPVKEAIVIVGVFHLFGTSFRTLFFARKINIKIALLFGIPSLIFSFLGASQLTKIPSNELTRIVGVALILFAIYNLAKSRIKLPKSEGLLIGGGAVVGFIAGLIGTAGAIRGAFLIAWNLSPEVYLGTGAFMGLGADITRVISYQYQGLINYPVQIVLILAITALIGTLIGKLLVNKVKQKVFSNIVFVALILSGIRLLIF